MRPPWEVSLLPFAHHWRFLKRFLLSPHTVGSVAPSSKTLAAALCEPYRLGPRPAAVLEIGAGTGPVTRCLGTLLAAEDRLDICEIQDDFADIIERDVLTHENFASAVAAGRVRLLRLPVQRLPNGRQYDFIISGLPLTSFPISDVQAVLAVVRRSLKPGGVFSYFEYVGLRRMKAAVLPGKQGRHARDVSSYLSENIARHQIHRRTILQNIPPAYARHLQFDS